MTRSAPCARSVRSQFVSGNVARDADIVACVIEGEIVCVNLVMIRGGHHLGDKNFFPRNAAGHDAPQFVEAFISQHYAARRRAARYRRQRQLGNAALEQPLSEHAGHKVQIIVNPPGERRAWLDMACKNARLGAQQQLGLHATQEARVHALQQALETGEAIRASNASTSVTPWVRRLSHRAWCTTRRDAKSEYRRFNIASITPGDDYGAMRDVLTRRYRRIVAGEGKLPGSCPDRRR